jgi:hypothetical protein
MPAPALTLALPSVLGAMPTALAVGVLCAGVIIEIVLVPGVLLPGGTVTLLAGALIGTGRPSLAVALPVVVAVIAGDQLAYFSGSAVARWWRRRRPGRTGREPARHGWAATWLTAAMPSLAGAAGIGYLSFAARVVVMRVPWLAAALSAGALAARSLAGIGHVAGIIGIVASAVVVTGLLAARHGPGITCALTRRKAACRRGRSSPTCGSPRRRPARRSQTSCCATVSLPASRPGSNPATRTRTAARMRRPSRSCRAAAGQREQDLFEADGRGCRHPAEQWQRQHDDPEGGH